MAHVSVESIQKNLSFVFGKKYMRYIDAGRIMSNIPVNYGVEKGKF